MVVKQLLTAVLLAGVSMAYAEPMSDLKGRSHQPGAPTESQAEGPRVAGDVFTNGPKDTSTLGNGGITGGPSAPPPFTNVSHGRPAADPIEIPEPASAMLVLAGLLGAGIAARRRRK